MHKKINFSSPNISLREYFSVAKVLSSEWLTTGKKTKQFESNVKEYIGLNNDTHAIAVNSATAGLHLTLEALGIKEGDEVITTVLTFTSTAEVIRYLGADPVFCDIDPETLNIDLEKVETLITPKTKAILVVHFAGNACNIDKLLSLKKKYNIPVIEDAAHSLSSTFNKKFIGAHGLDGTVFSFYANKTITSGGEGGMVIVKDKKLADRIRIMTLHGIDKLPYDRYIKSNSRSWNYDVIAPGYKYNLTDIAASIGISQLKRLPKFHKKRVQLAKLYDQLLKDLPIILPPRSLNIFDHSWHLYIIQFEGKHIKKRDQLIDFFVQKKVGFSLHYKPLSLHTFWKVKYNLNPNDFPNAHNYFKSALTLPLHTKLNFRDIKFVCKCIRDIFDIGEIK